MTGELGMGIRDWSHLVFICDQVALAQLLGNVVPTCILSSKALCLL